MPIQRGKDSTGNYYRWGNTGKKYFYKARDAKSRNAAYALAMRQARAIEWRKHSFTKF
jgi:ribosomal protein S11